MSITTKIDPSTGALTVTKAGSGGSDFFKGADLGASGTKVKLTKPMEQSVWALAAMRFVAGPLMAVGFKFTEDRRGGDAQIDAPELNAFWERPGVSKGRAVNRAEFMAVTAMWVMLEGHAFWIMDDSWLTRGKKNPLILPRPEQLRPICDKVDGDLIGWEYRTNSGAEYLLPEQVQQIKDPNPYDDFKGLPRWKAAELAASSDYAAGVFSKNLMENNGDRGPIVTSDGNLTDPQIEQITRTLRQKQIHSRRGDFKPAFLAGSNIKVESPSVQAVDAAFLGQRLENRHEVFIAFGVPPSFADVTASFSIGSASDRFKLIEETCMPLGELISDAMEVVSHKHQDSKRTLFVAFHWDTHSTMQQVRAERFESATKGVDRGMPWQTASDYFGLGLPSFPGWNVGRVPFNMTVVQPSAGSLVKGQESLGSNDEAKGDETKGDAGTESMREPDPERLKLWENLVRARAPWVKRFESRFNRVLMAARAETLANLEAVKSGSTTRSMVKGQESMGSDDKTKTGGEVLKTGALDLVFDLGSWLEEFLRGMSEVSRNAMLQAGLEMWEHELDRDDPLEHPSTEVMVALQKRQNLLAKTGTEIWNEVRESIADGIEAGDSIEQISKRVRESFNGISKRRSKAIAVTETAAAYETGRALTMREAGVEFKEWLTNQDERVRISHWDVDGQRVKIDEPFILGNGVELQFPAASGGPAEEVINCRCIHLAVGEE
jgi:SPP1 gp7 family putative phage head morphogenesis protein